MSTEKVEENEKSFGERLEYVEVRLAALERRCTIDGTCPPCPPVVEDSQLREQVRQQAQPTSPETPQDRR